VPAAAAAAGGGAAHKALMSVSKALTATTENVLDRQTQNEERWNEEEIRDQRQT
jgi:hypothetical protein